MGEEMNEGIREERVCGTILKNWIQKFERIHLETSE